MPRLLRRVQPRRDTPCSEPDQADPDPVELDLPAPDLCSTLAAVMPPTVEALKDAEGAATGHNGRYEAWSDAFYSGSQGCDVAPPGTTL